MYFSASRAFSRYVIIRDSSFHLGGILGRKLSSGPRQNRFVIESGSFPPSVQITQFTPIEWEEFIETCCRLMTGPGGKTYVRVKRLGGAGDGGRDIEARHTELAENEWDLYQAKRYRGVLSPTEFFPDLAKVLMHLTKETYPRPRKISRRSYRPPCALVRSGSAGV